MISVILARDSCGLIHHSFVIIFILYIIYIFTMVISITETFHFLIQYEVYQRSILIGREVNAYRCFKSLASYCGLGRKTSYGASNFEILIWLVLLLIKFMGSIFSFSSLRNFPNCLIEWSFYGERVVIKCSSFKGDSIIIVDDIFALK